MVGYKSATKGSYPSPATFSNLERASSYADPTVTGQFKGGLNTIMIVRYSETPVGEWPTLFAFENWAIEWMVVRPL